MFRIVSVCRLLVAAAIVTASHSTHVRAEECVTGVRILCPWTNKIWPPSGYARDWPVAARAAGYVVNRQLTPGCVLVYPGTYGNGISPYGHVAKFLGPAPGLIGGRYTVWIQDSSPPYAGSPGWTRQIRMVVAPDMTRCWAIQPK